MASIKFIFNKISTTIKCQKEDLMKDICQIFASNINISIDKLYFLYEGGEINYELTFNEQAKENDKKCCTMNILVYQLEDYNENNDNKKFIKSQDTIYPNFGENCFLTIKDYKISFCDELNNIILDEYESIQNLEQSKIYYICKVHNDKFNAYCKKCKINLCKLCEQEHEDKDNLLYYKDLIPQKEIIENQMNELKIKIDKFNEKIEEIIKILNKISKNMKTYYNINDNIFSNIRKNNINYELLKNVNEIINNNEIVLNDINEIINDNETINAFNNLITIYNKMNNKNNIFEDYKEILYLIIIPQCYDLKA